MNTPEPIWETDYKHDRRAHRHRCHCCNKIINAGEPVIMTRVKPRRTWAIHQSCGELQHSAVWTWREVMYVWGAQYLRKCGWNISDEAGRTA
jgi:hypothetical protein